MKQVLKLITGILIGSLLTIYLYMIYGLILTKQYPIAVVGIIGTGLLIKALLDYYITK